MTYTLLIDTDYGPTVTGSFETVEAALQYAQEQGVNAQVLAPYSYTPVADTLGEVLEDVPF